MKMEQRTKEQQEADRILVFVPHQTPAHSWVAYSDSDVINLAMESEHQYINEHFAPELGEAEVGRGYVPTYDQAIEALGHDLQVLTVLHNPAEVLDYLERSGPGRAVFEVQEHAELLGWIKSPRQAALDSGEDEEDYHAEEKMLTAADEALRAGDTGGSGDPLAEKLCDYFRALMSVEVDRDEASGTVIGVTLLMGPQAIPLVDVLEETHCGYLEGFGDWLAGNGGRS
jgi:hypothetical protein